MAENYRMQQRRATKVAWDTSQYVLAAGEIGVETDTTVIKIGDGVTKYTDLPAAFSSQYLPLLGKAADSDRLDGIDSTGFVQIGDTSALPTASKVALRNSGGRLKAAAATEDDDLATFLQVKGSGRYRGTGTDFPTTDLRPGDTFSFTGYGMFFYTGSVWRQLYALELTAAQRSSLSMTSATAVKAVYVGFRVFETDTQRIWQWGGTTPDWQYLGGGTEPTILLTVNTQNFNHYSVANGGAATARYEPLVLSRLPGDGVRISGLISITTQTNGGVWYQVVTAANIPAWARPRRRTIRYYPLNGSQTLGRLDMIPPDGTFGDAAPGTLAYYCPTNVAPGTIMNVELGYQPKNDLY